MSTVHLAATSSTSRAGKNYGGPEISYGCDYGQADDCLPGGGKSMADGLEQPITHWMPRSKQERLFAERKERIRDVREGPDGWLYLLTDDPMGRILRVGR
jgi:glucose/arabinose dehydrogenase